MPSLASCTGGEHRARGTKAPADLQRTRINPVHLSVAVRNAAITYLHEEHLESLRGRYTDVEVVPHSGYRNHRSPFLPDSIIFHQLADVITWVEQML